ncbi:MAG TPA: nucleotide pyrophosphohydrolase [Anaerolineae bacterium]|nr:nucleotide pyrophosphohydrolase [Anaerolineae bacterium]HIQ04665.1 nucleotide pyrophosphohydrolase [Anaerolineae bacterium]
MQSGDKREETRDEQEDARTTVAELRDAVRRFVNERNWAQFHNPKDLSISIAIEAAELLEEFQWLNAEEVATLVANSEERARVAAELADVLIYCLSLSNAMELDVSRIVLSKLEANARKYPAEQYQGCFRQRPSQKRQSA